MLKRWSLKLNLTGGSASISLRVDAETLIPSSAVESHRLSFCLKLRRLLPWVKFKPPSAPPTKRRRKKKSLSKIGFLRSLRKIRLFRCRAILPEDEHELPRRSLSPLSYNSRKEAAAVAVAVTSLCAVVVGWILSERVRQWCGTEGLPGQFSCLSSLYVPSVPE